MPSKMLTSGWTRLRNSSPLRSWERSVELLTHNSHSLTHTQDLAGVQKLQKKLAQLETDVSVHCEQIDSLTSQAKGFEESGHFDAESIVQRQQELVERYEGLQGPLERQKTRLTASHQLQQLFRDLEDEEVWMKEREAVAASTNIGERDLNSSASMCVRVCVCREGPGGGAESSEEASLVAV